MPEGCRPELEPGLIMPLLEKEQKGAPGRCTLENSPSQLCQFFSGLLPFSNLLSLGSIIGGCYSSKSLQNPLHGAYEKHHSMSYPKNIYTHSQLHESPTSLQVIFQYCLNHLSLGGKGRCLSIQLPILQLCWGARTHCPGVPSLIILNCALRAPLFPFLMCFQSSEACLLEALVS